jgi:hypothetical protein
MSSTGTRGGLGDGASDTSSYPSGRRVMIGRGLVINSNGGTALRLCSSKAFAADLIFYLIGGSNSHLDAGYIYISLKISRLKLEMMPYLSGLSYLSASSVEPIQAS